MCLQREKERAKRVIVELARQSAADAISGKIRLFKAFYFAHLYYVADTPDYLTEWPIVRMPMGPGIDRFDELIDELQAEGRLYVEQVKVGPYWSFVYRAGEQDESESLSPKAISAIRQAIEFASAKTGAQLSDITHEFSRSWAETENGREMNIYRDILKDPDVAIKETEFVSSLFED